MKRKRHNPEQIIRKLRSAEQLAQPRPNSCRCMPSPGGICCHLPPLAASLRRHVDEVGRRPKATEAKRLKELEQENSRLKRLLAEAELDKAML